MGAKIQFFFEFSIQFQKFVCVSHRIEEFDEILVFDDNGGCVVVRMETETLGVFKVLVDEDMDMMLCVVDQSEGGYASRFQAKVFFHSCFRGESEFSLAQPVFQVMDVHLVHALEKDKVMLVPFVVSEKEVFAVGGVELFPVVDGFLNGRDRGMEVDVEFDTQSFQRVNHFLLTFAHFVIDIIGVHVV